MTTSAARVRACAWLLAACGAAVPAFALAAPPAPLPIPVPRTTGDAALDARLLDIDRYGARYRAAFVDELVRYHAAPRDLVLTLLGRGWSPGDVYYACALAYVSGRSCRHVADGVADGATPDWIAIAQRLGVTPDSPRLARVHEGIAATYDRWGRPLPPTPAQPAGRMPADARAQTASVQRARAVPPRTPEARRAPPQATASDD